MKVKVQDNQTIHDIALQYTGSVDSVMDILLHNGKTDDTLLINEIIEIPYVVNQAIVDYFAAQGISIATSTEALDTSLYVPEPLLCQSDAFIIKVVTQRSGVSADNQFTIPCRTSFYTYDYNVKTSDGQSFIGQTGDLTITFPDKGVYTIEITENTVGGFPSIYFNNTGDRLKILEVVNWGLNKWQGFTSSFRGCSYLAITAEDTPDLSLATQLDNFFLSAVRFYGNNNFASIDTSTIGVFTQSFRSSNISVDLSSLDVSNASIMQAMFVGANLFDFNLGSWNLSNTLVNIQQIFASSGMSTENFTDTIVGWANNIFDNAGSPSGVNMANQNGMTFDTSRSGGANFPDAGAALTYITGTANWTISGYTLI